MTRQQLLFVHRQMFLMFSLLSLYFCSYLALSCLFFSLHAAVTCYFILLFARSRNLVFLRFFFFHSASSTAVASSIFCSPSPPICLCPSSSPLPPLIAVARSRLPLAEGCSEQKSTSKRLTFPRCHSALTSRDTLLV